VLSEDLVFSYVDQYNRLQTLDDAEDKIDKLVKVLQYVLNKMKDLSDDYQLEEFTATVGVELNALLLKPDGGISITWERS
jgi:molecular chaperone GrpE (heat shock protein)